MNTSDRIKELFMFGGFVVNIILGIRSLLADKYVQSIFLGILLIILIYLIYLHIKYIRFPFQMLLSEITLTIKDKEGKKARCEKKHVFRIYRDNIVDRIVDKIIADGSIENMSVSPGELRDARKEVGMYHIETGFRHSLPKQKEFEHSLSFDFINSFTKSIESYSIFVDYPVTRKVIIKIIFPRERECKESNMFLIKGILEKRLEKPSFSRLKDGRCQIHWERKGLKMNDTYKLEWEW